MKVLMLAILLIIVGFLGSMNFTPGHFQYDKRQCCGCGAVVYLTDEENVRDGVGCVDIACPFVMCQQDLSKWLLLLSALDLYK